MYIWKFTPLCETLFQNLPQGVVWILDKSSPIKMDTQAVICELRFQLYLL